MFPTTIWTSIRQAAASDRDALEGFAERYRAPVLRYVRSRGVQGDDAEDLTQDVFVRILRAGLLAQADRARGRFRGLLLTVARNAVTDRYRRGERSPGAAQLEGDLEPRSHDAEPRDAEFDQGWAWHLTERALERLGGESPSYRDVLQHHVDGVPQDRNKLWIARRKLAALLKNEVAFTCRTQADFEDELAYLSQYLRPSALAAIDGTDTSAV